MTPTMELVLWLRPRAQTTSISSIPPRSQSSLSDPLPLSCLAQPATNGCILLLRPRVSIRANNSPSFLLVPPQTSHQGAKPRKRLTLATLTRPNSHQEIQLPSSCTLVVSRFPPCSQTWALITYFTSKPRELKS